VARHGPPDREDIPGTRHFKEPGSAIAAGMSATRRNHHRQPARHIDDPRARQLSCMRVSPRVCAERPRLSKSAPSSRQAQ
jgi:hypothetical protein